MSDETNEDVDTSTGDDGGSLDDDIQEEMVPKRHLDDIAKQRKELKAQIREFKRKEREAQEAALREQGKNEEIITARNERIAELEAMVAKREREDRFSLTASAVAAKAGLPLEVAEGLLLREERVSGTDVALEEVTDEAVTDLAKQLRKAAPALFGTNGKGGSPNVPGLNKGNKDAGEDDPTANKWTARARARSAHNRKQRQ